MAHILTVERKLSLEDFFLGGGGVVFLKSVKRDDSGFEGFQALPGLEKGFNRVESDVDIPIFPMIVGKYLSGTGSKAVWIDSGNTSSTYAMASSGGEEVLDRVVVGRAFTAFQHFHICNRIEEFLEPETRYLVLPNIDQQYRKISEKERKDLFSQLMSKLEALNRERPEISIIYNFYRSDSSQICLELDSVTDNILEIEENSQGLHESSKDMEKSFYRDRGGLQTTIPYWLEKSTEELEVRSRGKNELHL